MKTIAEFRTLVLADYGNQRKNDKSSIAYAIGAISGSKNLSYTIYYDTYKRAELLAKFTELIQDDKNLMQIHKFATYAHITII